MFCGARTMEFRFTRTNDALRKLSLSDSDRQSTIPPLGRSYIFEQPVRTLKFHAGPLSFPALTVGLTFTSRPANFGYEDSPPSHPPVLPPPSLALEMTRNIDNVKGIGTNCVIKNAIVDKHVRIGNNCEIIGDDSLEDMETESYCIRKGIIVINKNAVIPDGTKIGLGV